jgi:predicted transcriptional regulator
MRKAGEWMNRSTDDPILEYLRMERWGTPSTIASAIGRSVEHTGKRCRVLVSHGLLDRPARGVYVINDDGVAYLDGELDTSEYD